MLTPPKTSIGPSLGLSWRHRGQGVAIPFPKGLLLRIKGYPLGYSAMRLTKRYIGKAPDEPMSSEG
ncbi:MAG: hypothetical protein ACFFBV_09520 [Promethearchaeota archaeon]